MPLKRQKGGLNYAFKKRISHKSSYQYPKNCSIAQSQEMISEIAQNLSPYDKEEILDLCGLTVAPVLLTPISISVILALLDKEDLHTGALSAAKGGVTSVICMANTRPVVDSVETLKDILTRAEKEKIHIYQTAAVSQGLKGEVMNDLDALKEAGACGFTDDGIPLMGC